MRAPSDRSRARSLTNSSNCKLYFNVPVELSSVYLQQGLGRFFHLCKGMECGDGSVVMMVLLEACVVEVWAWRNSLIKGQQHTPIV